MLQGTWEAREGRADYTPPYEIRLACVQILWKVSRTGDSTGFRLGASTGTDVFETLHCFPLRIQ